MRGEVDDGVSDAWKGEESTALPTISHLHFLVLATLADGKRSGRFMRQLLSQKKVERTGAAFYQMMAKLEKDDLVQGWYVERIVGDYPVKERHYQLTDKGITAWRQAFDFYAGHSEQRRVISTANHDHPRDSEDVSGGSFLAVEHSEPMESVTGG